jgi:hypothetical protein
MRWRNFSDANPFLQLDSTSPSPKDQLVKDQLFEAPASQL